MTITLTATELDQRLQALKRANWTRSRRAELKRDLRAGRVTVDGLLADPPEWLLTAKVFDYLLCVRKFGRVKINTVFARAGMSPSKTFGGLTERQRRELAGVLRGTGGRA